MTISLRDKLTQMFNEEAPIARHFGMRLRFDDQGRAIVELPYNPNLDHALKATHGGVYATMLDTAGWFTSAGSREGNQGELGVVTSELSIHFLKPAVRTSLRAVGQIIKSGKRQDIVEMHVYDEQDQLVGHAMGTFVVISDAP
ncbi:MAG: PaaI family thioesterase [Chloroflexi bacterium]|nr:PaaI family thioesterase [Chloroflexota bacterium]